MSLLLVSYVSLTLIGFVAGLTFMILFASRLSWPPSEVGKILFVFPAVVTGLLGMSLVSTMMHVWAPLWLAGMASLDAVLWWLVWYLWRLQHPR